MPITSRNNELIVSISKLRDKKYRQITGFFPVCGKKLAYEALSSGVKFKYVFATEKCLSAAKELSEKSGAPLYEVTEDVLRKLTDEKSPEGVCAVCVIPDKKPKIKDGFVLICDSLSDPGNAGTVLRSARAFGCGTVIFSAGCADIYSEKVLRGAMGAVFSDNIITGADTLSVISELKNRGFRIYAAALHTNAVPLDFADLSGNCAVMIGNEGRGLPDEIISAADEALFIEMEPECESLNAAVAASVILYRRYSGT